MTRSQIITGDCIAAMDLMPSNSVDAIVTDPPYGIRFMGKAWDGADIEKRAGDRRAFNNNAPGAGPNGGHNSLAAEAGKYLRTPAAMLAFEEFTYEWATEAFRLLKPGGYLLSFASTRTYHRMVCGAEDAGFEIRDQIGWVFGSGFPKSHNGAWGGTALKPAWEPIVVARKPLIGTVEANWLIYGTGALNIDGCRVESEGETNPSIARRQGAINHLSDRPAAETEAEGRMASRQSPEAYRAERTGEALGRWPANLVHDGSDEVLEAFPNAPGQMADASSSSSSSSRKTQNVYGTMTRGNASELRPSGPRETEDDPTAFAMKPGARRLDSGSAARFFYCAKANKKDRNVGCEGLPLKPSGMVSNTSGQHITRRDEGGAPPPAANNHPTVKPTELMRWLCRLVTPAGGLVLDPFMGSGSTGRAARLEGFDFIGIEREVDYVAIAEARIAA